MNINFKNLDKNLKAIGGLTAQDQKINIIIMEQYNTNTTNVTSHGQTGGETIGNKPIYNQNVYVWKARGEGFLFALFLELCVAFILKIIYGQ